MQFQVLVLAGITMAGPLIAFQAQQTQPQPPPPPLVTEQEVTQETRTTSRAFMKRAAETGRAEMDLAALAVEKTQDDRVRAFAHQLQKDHQRTNNDLTALAVAKNVELPDELSAQAAAARRKLEQLSGAAFDQAFADQMVRDHQTAIRDFMQESRSSESEMKSFADRTLPTLRDHLQRAQTLKSVVGRHQSFEMFPSSSRQQ